MITQNWGTVDYSKALQDQLAEVDRVSAGEEDRLVFCTHPPVVTVGRSTEASDIQSWTGSTVEVSRGGRATYHGPNQIVVYPILNLIRERKNLKPRDLRQYLTELGNSLVLALSEFGIKAEYRSLAQGDQPSVTGVWVGERKIASIGVAVKKWVSFHGIALNMDLDPKAFQGINPCGFSASVMTSVEETLGRKISHDQMRKVLDATLRHRLQ